MKARHGRAVETNPMGANRKPFVAKLVIGFSGEIYRAVEGHEQCACLLGVTKPDLRPNDAAADPFSFSVQGPAADASPARTVHQRVELVL